MYICRKLQVALNKKKKVSMMKVVAVFDDKNNSWFVIEVFEDESWFNN